MYIYILYIYFFLDVGTDIEKSVITYYYPPLEIPVQVYAIF